MRSQIARTAASLAGIAANTQVPGGCSSPAGAVINATLVVRPPAAVAASGRGGDRARDAGRVPVGRAVIANPDLVERWKGEHPENEPNPRTFYTDGAAGYVDYPTLKAS